MKIIILALIIAITIMFVAIQIADTLQEKYKNVDKIIKNNKNCEISIKDKESKWWNMTLEETQDKEDILILMLIQERDRYIELLETENIGFRNLTADLLTENKRLHKIVKELRSKRNG